MGGPDERIGSGSDPARRQTRPRVAASRTCANPRDVGPARYLGVFDGHHLSSRVGGKFRNFIPFADGFKNWSMFTKADKDRDLPDPDQPAPERPDHGYR